MGGLVIETVRPGVQFTSAAAASFRRLGARLGRRVGVNSTYRDWNVQMSMYLAWEAWVAGRGPRPWHARAIHPDRSLHTRGLGWDSNEWTTPGFIEIAEEHGWIRTAVWDPTERHHFEYQVWRDQHRNQPAGNGGGTTITPVPKEDEMNAEQDERLRQVERDMAWLKNRIGGRDNQPTITDRLRVIATALGAIGGVVEWIKTRVGGSVKTTPSIANELRKLREDG